MTGPRTDVGEAKLLEELSDIARMKVDAEPLGDDTLEVEPTPAHDAVDLKIRTRLDDLRELSQLLRRKARLGTLRPIVDEAVRTRSVEAMDPVTQGLAVHTADLRRGAPIHSIPDRSQRQKPPALVDILRPPGRRPKLLGRIVLSQSDR
jgi:hypothetical protein